MAEKKLTHEEYERITNENTELFAKLDKQIVEERRKDVEFLSALSEDEQAECLWEENKKTNAEAADRFNSSCTTTSKRNEQNRIVIRKHFCLKSMLGYCII